MSSREYFVFHSFGDNSSDNWITTKIDPYEFPAVRNWDQKLHRALSEIIPKRTRKDSIYQRILEQEPALRKLLPITKELSLLWITVLGCYQDSAELLVHSGAHVNGCLGLNNWYKLNQKSTILHALLQMYPSEWNERFISLVMDHGANLKALDSKDRSLLHVAVEYGRVKVAERLLKRGANVKACDFSRMTPLLDAVRTNEAGELVPLLMRHKADVRAKDIQEMSALHHLASAPVEHVDVARVLIEKGVSCEAIDIYRYFPISWAVRKGKIKLVNLYLDHGVDVNVRLHKKFGGFLLHYAAGECKDPAMLRTLLKRGAKIDQRNLRGKTALYYLVTCQDPIDNKKTIEEKVKTLLSLGADPFAECHDGLTIFDYSDIATVVNPSIRRVLKMMSLREACSQLPIEFKDDRITNLKEYPEQWNHYQDCLEEISRMKSTKFFKSGAFLDLLAKCQCQVVSLMRNREFESKFKLFDRSAFPVFAEDILEAFERAQRYYRSVLEQEDLIHEAVYNILPHMLVRKVVSYNLDCEICELKKIVQASRGM